jgi:hypothetical protein
VQNDEEVVGVLVDLRPLVSRRDVLEVELVEVEVLRTTERSSKVYEAPERRARQPRSASSPKGAPKRLK